MVCKRNHTQHKESKLTKLWFSLTRQIYSDSRGKCKDMLEQGSTAVTTALTCQVGGNHRFEKHAINGTKYTFKDGGIGASPNWERPSIWLNSIKIFLYTCTNAYRCPQANMQLCLLTDPHAQKMWYGDTTAQRHCRVVYTPYWFTWQHTCACGHKNIGHFVGRLGFMRKPRQEGAQEAITCACGNCQTVSSWNPYTILFTGVALALNAECWMNERWLRCALTLRRGGPLLCNSTTSALIELPVLSG